MASKVFSGRKSSVMIRLPKPIETISEVPVTPVFGVAYKNGSSSSLKLGDVTLEQNDIAIYTNQYVKAYDSATKTSTINAYPSKKTGGVGEVLNIDLIIPSCNKFSLSNGGDVVSWSSFGSVYKDKLPTIMDWSGSIGAKVDFGDNPAQIIMYNLMLHQTKAELYFYLRTVIKDGEVDTEKVIVQRGNAYIKTFNIDTDPENVADLTMDFEGDGELTLVIYGDELSADWSTVLTDDSE